MGKVKKVANKISEDQLTKVRDQQQKLNEALRTLGVLEVQKQNLRNQIEGASKEIEALIDKQFDLEIDKALSK